MNQVDMTFSMFQIGRHRSPAIWNSHVIRQASHANLVPHCDHSAGPLLPRPLPHHVGCQQIHVSANRSEYSFISLRFKFHSSICLITLKVPVRTIDALRTGPLLNWIITAQWEGMGDVGLARYEPALLPPCSTIRVLSYSNCQRSTHCITK